MQSETITVSDCFLPIFKGELLIFSAPKNLWVEKSQFLLYNHFVNEILTEVVLWQAILSLFS